MTGIVPFSNMQLILKNLDRLPPHITRAQINLIRQWIGENEHGQIRDTDLLLVNLMFELGGRVRDICQMRRRDIDFENKIVTLYMHKTDRTSKRTISANLGLQINLFMDKYKNRDPLLGFTRQNAWQRVKKFGEKTEIGKLHPHMFRHGMAVHLMNNGVPIPVIATRLGHANVMTTMQMYLKVTPEIQRQHMQGINFD